MSGDHFFFFNSWIVCRFKLKSFSLRVNSQLSVSELTDLNNVHPVASSTSAPSEELPQTLKTNEQTNERANKQKPTTKKPHKLPHTFPVVSLLKNVPHRLLFLLTCSLFLQTTYFLLSATMTTSSKPKLAQPPHSGLFLNMSTEDELWPPTKSRIRQQLTRE